MYVLLRWLPVMVLFISLAAGGMVFLPRAPLIAQDPDVSPQMPVPTEVPALEPLLQLGSQGEAVAAVQVRLALYVYFAFPSDGVYGQSTYWAVYAFRDNNALPPSGAVDAAAWDRLFNSALAVTRPPLPTPEPFSAFPVLQMGSQGEALLLLQRRLNELGYFKSAIDGIFGDATYRAVYSFQYFNGLASDGVVGRRTWERLLVNDGIITAPPDRTPIPVRTPTPRPRLTPQPPLVGRPTMYDTLAFSAQGETVARLQARLMELGYLKGEADGLYGRDTQDAVRQFQRFNKLTADGIAGNATQRTLYDSPDVVPALRKLK